MIQQTTRTKIIKVDGYGLTPTMIFQRLQGQHKVLLETATSFTSQGRYSIIGANPRKTYTGSEQLLKEYVHSSGKTYTYKGDLVQLLKQVMPQISTETSYPFTGGAIGYFRYNRQFNEIEAAQFHIYDYIFLFDHLTEELIGIYTNIEPTKQDDQLEEMIAQILAGTTERTTYHVNDYQFKAPEEQIIQQLNSVKTSMSHKKITQMIITKLKTAKFIGDPFAYYRVYRKNSPSPFQYYLSFDSFQVFGTAKNGLLKIENQIISSNDEKSVSFIENESTQSAIYTYSGKLKQTFHAIDVLSTVLPATSMIGSPFKEALKLLEQCESDERILFGGAVGYIGFNGQIEFAHTNDAILIRNGEAIKENGFEINVE